MGSGRNDEWRVLMEATLVPPAERLPAAETARREQRTPERAEGIRRTLAGELGRR